MNNEIDDGGFVYPHTSENAPQLHAWGHGGQGITRRDWLAGLAMQGVVSNPLFMEKMISSPEKVVEYPYRIADAMIKESRR